MNRTPIEPTLEVVDRAMMERCLALAMHGVDLGEYPYAAVISRNGVVVCESTDSVRHDRDATRHAELVALSKALRRLDRVSLEECTIYANAELCALCCYEAAMPCARRASAASCLACRPHSPAE